MAVPTHDDDESVSDLFAFSLPVLERDAPGETSTRPSTSRRPLTAFGSQPPGTGRRPDEQAEQDVTDGPFAFALPTSGSHEDAHSVERPTTARPKTSFGAGEASAFGSFASRPQTATSAQSPPSQPYSNSPVAPGGARLPPPDILVEEDDEDDDDDDDCGMFSFHRPATGEAPPPGSMVPIEVALQGQGFDFMRSPPKTNDSEEPMTPASALASDSVDVRDEVAHQAEAEERKATAQSSVRRRSRSDESSSHEMDEPRGVWHLPDDPDRFTSDPFDARLFAAGHRYGNDGASDKDEIMSSADGRATGISLHHLGLSGHTSSLDDTKVADLEAAAGIRRRRPPPPLEDSVYPEVQASVSNVDDPSACVLTLRVWFLGLLFCLVFAALNTYFSLRYPAPLITPIITQLFTYPFGRFLAKYMPAADIKLPIWTRRLGMPHRVSLNPGPFSIKEHALLVIMANVSTGPPLGLNYSVAAEKFYGRPQPFGFDILLVFTTQMIGFGAAGLCRRFLVWPASMLWPQNLVFCTLLNTFHAEIEDEEPGPSRLRFFTYVFFGAFCWFWLPGFLFVALSAFSWVCWIAPNNVVVNQLFGVASGLGMGLFSFDWSQIAFVASPLIVPWWAQLNIFGGFFVAFWIIAPIMYYINTFNSAYLPISTSSVFDRFGQPYDAVRVLDTSRLALNVTAYNEYSPVYMPVTYLVSYGTAFMLSIGILVHTLLFNGRDIWNRLLRQHVKGDVDIHMKLMRNYPDVPDWAYLAFLLIAFALSAVTVACWPTGMPVWALLVSVAMGVVYIIPAGYIYALTSYNVSVNVIAEFVGGYIMTDKPLANVLFKIYTSNALNLGLYFSQDLKLGHYMKIPPRETFKVQVVAVIITSCAQVGVKRFLVATVPTLCDADQSARLICPSARTTFSASIIWGLIGPVRLFDFGAYYHPLLYWMIGGAVVPFVTWLILRRWPQCWLRYFHLPIALTGLEFVPPASGINFSSSLIVGFIFQYLVRRINFDWWSKYNFVLSAAMDAGTIVCGILIFLTLQLPRGGTISVNWWGNEVFTKTLDWAGVAFKTAPPEGFGATTW
ncbi:hypothetical protein B0A53_05342 [Rhodotorula sp. CCFEE 5036]|nr:hypothetical protein B0A53_05342 [Rhodotorula sp. CCFEE 5036]